MIRIGVLGAGRHSRREHLPALALYAQRYPAAIDLAVLCDRDVNVAREYGFARHCDSLDRLLDLRPDAIVAVTPVDATADLAVRILGTGIPLLLEKPLGRTLDEARRIVDAAAGRHAMVSMNRRFDPALVALARWLAGRRIEHVRATVVRHARSPVGFSLDVGIHAVDVLRFLAGALAAHDGPTLTFASGAAGVIELRPDGGTGRRLTRSSALATMLRPWLPGRPGSGATARRRRCIPGRTTSPPLSQPARTARRRLSWRPWRQGMPPTRRRPRCWKAWPPRSGFRMHRQTRRRDWNMWIDRTAKPMAALLGLALSATAAAQDLALQLNLFEAIPATNGQVVGGPTLILDLARTGDRWERVWGGAPRFNKGLAQGLVLTGTTNEAAMDLSVAVGIPSDAWTKGGRGQYAVTLKRTDTRTFDGTYTGVCRGLPVRGSAQAVLRPSPTAVGAPIALGEHPRLLFRKADLPSLREKAKTPFGQAAVAKLTGVIGSAVKYQLTGETHYATDIIPDVETLIADTGVGDKMVRGRILGWRFEQIALAYDLCYDAWPEPFKRRVAQFVTGPQGWRAFTQMSTFQKEIQWVSTNPYPGPIRYGPALAALAVWGEKGPAPARPVAPFAVTNQAGVLPPGAARDGVPVVAFASGAMPDEWAYKLDADGPLRPLSHEKDKGYYEGRIDITSTAERRYGSTVWFYTTIENEAPRWVRVELGHGGCTLTLSGQRLAEGEIVRLEKGRYPIEVVAPVGETSPWGRECVQPRLTEEPAPESGLAALTRLSQLAVSSELFSGRSARKDQ